MRPGDLTTEPADTQTTDEVIDALGAHIRRANEIVVLLAERGWRARLDTNIVAGRERFCATVSREIV